VARRGPQQRGWCVVCLCCWRDEWIAGNWCGGRREGVCEADREVDSSGEVEGCCRVGQGEERVGSEAID
jgi:hypothetical protein